MSNTDTDTNAAGNAQQWPTNNPGTKPNANPERPPHDNPDAVAHAAVGDAGKPFEGSNKEMGLVHAPITSANPTSQSQSDNEGKKDFKMVTKANFKLNHYIHENGHTDFAYPFKDVKAGDGMFIPVPKGGSTDKLMMQMHSQIEQYRKQNSEIARDENGDDIMEDLCINVKKRNEDGTVQVDGDKPRLTVRSGFTPKLIGPTFAVKAVVKGDEISDGGKADGDGVLIVRMT